MPALHQLPQPEMNVILPRETASPQRTLPKIFISMPMLEGRLPLACTIPVISACPLPMEEGKGLPGPSPLGQQRGLLTHTLLCRPTGQLSTRWDKCCLTRNTRRQFRATTPGVELPCRSTPNFWWWITRLGQGTTLSIPKSQNQVGTLFPKSIISKICQNTSYKVP